MLRSRSGASLGWGESGWACQAVPDLPVRLWRTLLASFRFESPAITWSAVSFPKAPSVLALCRRTVSGLRPVGRFPVFPLIESDPPGAWGSNNTAFVSSFPTAPVRVHECAHL